MIRPYQTAFVCLLASTALFHGQDDLAPKSATLTRKVTPSPTATAAAQADAMKKYPALAREGTGFNREFLARCRRYQTENPAFFEDQSWPLNLADEVAKAGVATAGEAVAGGIQLQGRTAVPPAGVPPTLLRAIEAGNNLQTRSYKYGGGRDELEDWGYDCSGSVSYVLIKAGLLNEPRTSSTFATYGEAGPGRWITVFATSGHVFMTIGGLRLDTGGRGGVGERGPRWSTVPRPASGYTMRHPPGF